MTEKVIQKTFRVTESTNKLIQRKMHLARTTNFRIYATKMCVDGAIYHTDFSNLKDLIHAINRIGNNINQVTKKANETNSIYKDDVIEIKKEYTELTKLINAQLLTDIKQRSEELGSHKNS